MHNLPVTKTEIIRVENNQPLKADDLIVVEEPLEIRIGFGSEQYRKEISLAVTMRTPGQDETLVMGLLISEGIIKSKSDIISLKYCLSSKHSENIMRANLSYDIQFDEEKYKRNLLSSSSCGICGKAYIDSIILQTKNFSGSSVNLKSELIYDLGTKLSKNQSIFKHTGGLHAAALFNTDGEFIISSEDIGRHNALDKLIGQIEMLDIDKSNKFILLSGRIGFELVQKCLMTNIRSIVAIGAPSSLSIQMAKENKMLLIGFLKSNRFNIYSGSEFIN